MAVGCSNRASHWRRGRAGLQCEIGGAQEAAVTNTGNPQPMRRIPLARGQRGRPTTFKQQDRSLNGRVSGYTDGAKPQFKFYGIFKDHQAGDDGRREFGPVIV